MKQLIILLLFGALSGCAFTNRPPDPGTPWPAAHAGAFAEGLDTLFFNGDGKSVSWHFQQALDGLNAKGKGVYVFQFGNEAWRYDTAEKFLVIPAEGDGSRSVFILNRPVTAEAIGLLIDGSEARTFNKVKEEQPL